MINHKTHCNQSTDFPLADLTFTFYVTVPDIEKTAQSTSGESCIPDDLWREINRNKES